MPSPPSTCSFLCEIWQYLDSNFSAALFGALFGAVGAQWLGAKAERRKRLIEELRSTNAAINVAFTVATTYCSLKSQHVRELKRKFDNQRQELEDFKRARAEGKISKEDVFRFDADFESISPPNTPMEILRALLFEKLSLTGRPLSFVVFLSQSVEDLNTSIDARNGIIQECLEQSPLPEDVLVPLYFGLKNKHGHVDQRYASSLNAMAGKLDDCIFLSTLLVADLEEHGKYLVKALGRSMLRVTTIDFTKAKEQNLIPDSAPYADWMSLPKPISPEPS